MSSWIDIKYVNIVAFRLRNFKWTRPGKVANCACPICGDSEKDKHKARGYFLVDTKKCVYTCHNCGVTLPLGKFLELEFPLDHQEYKLEKFAESGNFIPKPEPLVVPDSKPSFKPKEFLKQYATRLDGLQGDHPANVYINSRGIQFLDLWYTDSFKTIAEAFESSYAESNLPDEPRIIIPFRDQTGELVGFQGRALGKAKLRYITIKKNDAEIVFGMDRVDFNKNTVFVLEGALDSTFLPNAIAASGSSLQRFDKMFTKEQLTKCVFLFDNEPRNPQIVNNMKRMLVMGHRVVVWEKSTPKDINEMLLSGMSKRDLATLIRHSITEGPAGLLKLAMWRRS